MNPVRQTDQWTNINKSFLRIMDNVSEIITKRYETPKSREHKEWNVIIEDKRKQKKQLKKLRRIEKTDADSAIAALIKEHSADITEAIRNNIIKTHETHKNTLMKVENEPDGN